jgi:hypothetical protein
MKAGTISPVEYAQWACNPITEDFIQGLRETRQETLEAWARGAYVGDDGERTLMANARALGSVDIIEQIISTVEEHKRNG